MPQERLNYFSELFKNELEEIVGKQNVIFDQEELDCNVIDMWWITRYEMFSGNDYPRAWAIVFPEDKYQVARVVKLCANYGVPVIPRGGGAGDSGGSTAQLGGIIVDTKKMDQVLQFNERSQTVRIQPGILQKHLEEYLNRKGYTMNHFPASFHTATVGGFISTNGTGVLSSKYGKLIDMVHQVEVVMPDGSIFRSLPVNHHSTGPDLSKLFIGAEGTLGILTEALIKVRKLPESRRFLAYLLPDLKTGIEIGRVIMTEGLVPSIMRLYDELDTEHILKDQYGLEGDGCFIMTGFDGRKEIVDAEIMLAKKILDEANGKDLGDEQAKAWWNNRLKSYYPPLDYFCEPWMTAVTDTVASYEDIENCYFAMKKAVEENKEHGAIFHAHFSHWYDWGTSFYPTILLKDVPEDREEAIRVYNSIVASCARASIANGGVINEHHGIGLRFGRIMKEGYGEESYAVLQKIKSSLDPNNIMNPGKLGFKSK
jgi:FAD/FMN-containing dehydrogenases